MVLAELGKQHIDTMRADVLKIDLRVCGLTDLQQSESFKKLVEKGDPDLLTGLLEDREALFERLAPPLKCNDCGSTNIDRQVSKTGATSSPDRTEKRFAVDVPVSDL